MSDDMDLPKLFSKVMDIFATSMPMLQYELLKLDEKMGERFEPMERVVRGIQEELAQMRGTLWNIETRLREVEANMDVSFQ